jgi:hypothetical protein
MGFRVQFTGLVLAWCAFFAGCTDGPLSPADLQLQNTRQIYCPGNPYPITVNSSFVYVLSAYDLYGNWVAYNVFFDPYGNPIEACSGYPIFGNFINPYAQGVFVNLTSFKTVINRPDGNKPTESTTSTPMSVYITVSGSTNTGVPPVVIGPGLSPGQSYEVSDPIQVAAGTTYEDVVVIDPDSVVSERDEGNNEGTNTLGLGRQKPSPNRYVQKIHIRVPDWEELVNMTDPFFLLDMTGPALIRYESGQDFASQNPK